MVPTLPNQTSLHCSVLPVPRYTSPVDICEYENPRITQTNPGEIIELKLYKNISTPIEYIPTGVYDLTHLMCAGM